MAKLSYENSNDSYEEFVSEIVPRVNAAIDIAERAAVFTGPHIHEQRKPVAIGGVYCSAASGRHQWGFKNLLPVLLYGNHPSLYFGAKVPTAIASNARADENGHPCPKPLEWIIWLVELASSKGQTILDPFAGSCTTGVAAIRTGRKCILIEKELKYCQIGAKRLAEACCEGEGQFRFPEADLFSSVESQT